MTLVWPAVGFLIGIVLGAGLALPLVPLLCVSVVLLGCAWARRSHRFALFAVAGAGLLLGLARAPHQVGPSGAHDLAFYNGRPVTVEGVVTDEPDVRDTGANYVVSAHRVTVAGRAINVAGKVQVHTNRSRAIEYGEAVILTGKLISPVNGEVPYRDVLARRGIGSTMHFPMVLDRGPTSTGVLGWIVPLRERLERGIDAWLPEPEAALLIAITLGARSASLGDLSPLLVATGLIHIIAISGIKVAMVAGTLHQLLWRLRSPRAALIISLSALWIYVLLTGATVSGVRSAVMWTLVFVGAALGRGTVGLVSLVLTAAVMVAFDPTLPWDTAFLLSTIGTFSIVALTNPFLRPFRWVISPFRESLCVTLAAQVGTLPVVAVGFHLVSGTGPLANALVLPLLPVLILGGFLVGALSDIAWAAAPLASMLYGLLHGTVLLVQWLGHLPGTIPVSSWAEELSLVYYTALGCVARYVLRRANWAPVGRPPGGVREIALGLLLAATLATLSVTRADAGPKDALTWLGSGDALLLQSHGRVTLIGGSARPYQLLERVGEALPYNRHLIDLIVVTDPRQAQGLEGVLRHYAVSEVLDVGAEYASSSYAHWRAELRHQHVLVYALRTGVRAAVGSARIDALSPDALYPDSRNCTGILRLTVGRARYLIAGGAGAREQEEMLFRGENLKADALVLTDGPPDRRFVRMVGPKTVFTSAKYLPWGRSLKLRGPRDLPLRP